MGISKGFGVYLVVFLALMSVNTYCHSQSQPESMLATERLKCWQYVKNNLENRCGQCNTPQEKYNCCVGFCREAIKAKSCIVVLPKTDPDGVAYCHETCVQAIGGDIDLAGEQSTAGAY